MTVDGFIARLERVKRNGAGWMARCPAHEDREPSLSVSEGDDGRVLVHCHAGCTVEAIVAALGLELHDLHHEEVDRAGPTIVATYDYVDEAGALLFQAVRYTPKNFKQRRPDGRGGWIWRLDKTRRVLYRLPRVLEAVAAGDTVYVVEGEKDVAALEKAGVVATCNPMGAGKWHDSYAESLRGVGHVVIIADRDGPGLEHAMTVRSSLRRAGIAAMVVQAAEGKDAADHLAAGRKVEEFVPVAELRGGPTPDLAELLEELAGFLRRFVVMSAAQVTAITLWIIHTHAIETAETAAYLAATSAEKRSGKTRLLEVLELIVRKPLSAANISDAALFRAVDEMTPTVLFDEVDAIFGPKARDREDLRGMLNAGYRRGALVYRMAGANNSELRRFAVFCAKAFAGIGNLPDTIADRTIGIRLERRTSEERIERFRRREVEPDANRLHERIGLWVEARFDDLVAARPELPDELDDRAQDVWEPLLAIADLAGADWPKRARAAALELSTGEGREDESLGARLLADIRDAFDATGRDRLPTADLIDELATVEESPWGDWFGKTITPQALGKLLKPYRIKTMPIWAEGVTHRGYKREQFEDAWLRVLGVRGVRSVRSESPSHEAPNTPNTPNTHHANGANSRIPLPGDPGFPLHVDIAFQNGHLTERELQERLGFHHDIVAANGAPAEPFDDEEVERLAAIAREQQQEAEWLASIDPGDDIEFGV